MKKLLSALLGIALAATAAAENAAPRVEAEYGINVYTGAYYNAGDGEIVIGDPENFGDGVSAFDLEGRLSYEDIGAQFVLRATNLAESAYPKILSAFAYFNFFEERLRFQAGVIGENEFSTGYSGYDAFAESGLLVVAKPFDGLTLGYLLPVGTVAGEFGEQAMASTFALSFSIPEMLKAQVWVRQFDDPALIGDVSITAIKNLSVLLEFSYNDSAYWGESDALHLSEMIAYSLGNFYPGLKATQYLPGEGDSGFMLKPFVAYFLNKSVSFGVEYAYANAAQAAASYHGSLAYHVADIYAKYDFTKGFLKVQPGYDSAEGRGIFVRSVFDVYL